jgi:hypothetical protein
MKETLITLPELGMIAGTRAALGAGLGLLLADRLGDRERRAVGWTLFLFGAISTIPLAIEVLGRRRAAESNRLSCKDESGDRTDGRQRHQRHSPAM